MSLSSSLSFGSELCVPTRLRIEKPTYDYVSFKRLVTTSNVGNTLAFIQASSNKTGFVSTSVVLPILTVSLFTQAIIQRRGTKLLKL